MNEHTRKLLDDARKEQFADVLADLDYNDININACDHEGKTVLHYAAISHSDAVIVKTLTKFDVNINIQDKSGKTPLHYAAYNQLCQRYELIPVHPISKINEPRSHKRILVPYYDDHAYEKPLHLLLQHKDIKVNIQDHLGRTALHYAASNNIDQYVRILLNCQDSSLTIQDKAGRIPLHYAIKQGGFIWSFLLSSPLLQVTMEDNDEITLLQYAIQNNKTSSLHRLLSVKDIDVQSAYKYSSTLLHEAVINCSTDCMKELLSYKDIDLHSKDAHGRTPLQLAELLYQAASDAKYSSYKQQY